MKRPLACLLGLVVAASAPADALRDPTRPPSVGPRSAAVEATPVLTAVLSSGERRSAIVNGRLVHAGQMLGSVQIEAVLEDGVRYRQAGVVREVHLPQAPQTIKKPAASAPREAIGGQ